MSVSVDLQTVIVAAALLFAASAPSAESAADTGTPVDGTRPRIGLVLSGGGARGAGHFGILNALEEPRIPIDAVAGTSMGAVVGSPYASGLSAAEIEQLIGSVDWQDAFRDRPAPETLNLRRKGDASFASARKDGAAFVGLDTPLGRRTSAPATIRPAS
jgi:Patatin-like phospholipase